jgi:hypothetical protein
LLKYAEGKNLLAEQLHGTLLLTHTAKEELRFQEEKDQTLLD